MALYSTYTVKITRLCIRLEYTRESYLWEAIVLIEKQRLLFIFWNSLKVLDKT